MSSSAPPPLPPDTSVDYRSRTSALDQEVTLRLKGKSLILIHQNGAREVRPLAELSEITLRFFPTRFRHNRYECLLRWHNHRRLKICSQFFAGLADFHDQSPQYRKWILELHRITTEQNPDCEYRQGLSVLRYTANALFMVGVFGLLIAVMIAFASAIPSIAIIKLVVIIFYIPLLITWFHRNVPGRYRPDAIPDKVLPPK